MADFPTTLLPCLYRLYSKPLQIFELYLSEPYTSPSHYFVANNKDIIFGGITYTALAIKRSPIKMEESTIINSLEIGLDNVDLEFKNLVASGQLSKKRCVCKLVFDGFLSSSSAYKLIIDGDLDEPKGDDNWVTMTIKPFSCFEREYPRRIFQKNCNNLFCDEVCGLSLDDFTFAKTILTISETEVTFAEDGKDDNYFLPGYCEFIVDSFTVVRPVKSSTQNSIILRVALEDLPEVGSSFNAVKLCSKTLAICNDTFSNKLAFGGFPQVPREPVL